MKLICNTALLLLLVLNSSAQDLNLISELDVALNETSGLLYINNTLITHNDSDATNQLFDVNPNTGTVTRTVTISNATNTDWEDITNDDTYIYIGDIGNNAGDRTNLKIYRILIAEYFSSTSVTAEEINYSYNDQTDFSTSPFATNFDAETLIHYNNNLYIFTKNWLDGKTNIYELSKSIGTHSATFIDTIEVGGLTTAGSFNLDSNTVLLCGYGVNGPFVIYLEGFNNSLFSNGTITKTEVSVPTGYSSQIEGLIPVSTTDYYITAEANNPDLQALYGFNISTLKVEEFEDQNIIFYPNPAKRTITINGLYEEVSIYSLKGQFLKSSKISKINISDLAAGVYIIKFQEKESKTIITKQLVIKR
ncbi:MAG: T9SS type A sorting domain-containing protein [Winogradskyella sp.]|uniref:T9SS type A sorting domain-containing protein n=1 Tax=Winogradskyella sp. TaxID=1883156 RepID=UPI0018020ABB|nr:T9SS type A sorting domain-containing protein [Winogradskyella sp.]